MFVRIDEQAHRQRRIDMSAIIRRLTHGIVGFCAITSTLLAQQPLWVRHTSLGYKANAMLIGSSGDIYITGKAWRPGTGHDYLTVKYDADGNQGWHHYFSGETITFEDSPAAIAEDQAGNVIVTGTMDIEVNNTAGTGYGTIKYNFLGNPAWGRIYRGIQSIFPSNQARAIATDSLSNIYITGSVANGGNIGTISYGPTGNVRWVRLTAGGWGNAVKVDGLTGDVYVAGKNSFYSILIKYSSNGNVLWAFTESSFQGEAFAIDIDTQGNIYVAGVASGDTRDVFVSKFNSSGVRQWVRIYDGGRYDDVKALELDVNRNVYLTGISQGAETGNDYVTLKYDTNGNLQWVRRYHHGDDRAYGLAVGFLSGNVYVTGSSSNNIATLKYDTNGNQQWVRRYEFRTGEGIGVGLYEYELGVPTVYVVGTTQSNYTVIKYPDCYVEGDVDGNCCVDDADLLETLFGFGQTGIDLKGDLNSDGVVDDADLLQVLFNFGRGC